jgi:hypothetical protein
MKEAQGVAATTLFPGPLRLTSWRSSYIVAHPSSLASSAIS